MMTSPLSKNHWLSRLGASWFGLISYGIYMWHFLGYILARQIMVKLFGFQRVGYNVVCPLGLSLVVMGICLTATVIVAFYSYKYFETPAREWIRGKKRFSEVAKVPQIFNRNAEFINGCPENPNH
jgi:peptidoglycan/LPS O-acetylase OafA/YrhL